MATSRTDIVQTACLMLAIIQSVMLASLWFGVAPHPPRAVAPFAMAPFLAVAIGTAFCASRLAAHRSGRVLAGLAAVLALVSFGPQKYLDAAFPEIWIAVLASQIAVLCIVYALFLQRSEAR